MLNEIRLDQDIPLVESNFCWVETDADGRKRYVNVVIWVCADVIFDTVDYGVTYEDLTPEINFGTELRHDSLWGYQNGCVYSTNHV
jgi:hypothetical protein